MRVLVMMLGVVGGCTKAQPDEPRREPIPAPVPADAGPPIIVDAAHEHARLRARRLDPEHQLAAPLPVGTRLVVWDELHIDDPSRSKTDIDCKGHDRDLAEREVAE